MLYMEQYLKAHPKFKALMQAPGVTLSYSRPNPNAEDGLENLEIQIIQDTPTHIYSKATFIINECADILWENGKGKYVKLQ